MRFRWNYYFQILSSLLYYRLQYKFTVEALLITRMSLSSFPTSLSSEKTWKPKREPMESTRVIGANHNTETIGSIGFHHIEFYCGDAKNTAYRFAQALGMRITGETGQMTGNDQCMSYALESGDVRLLMTAPYSQMMSSRSSTTKLNSDDEVKKSASVTNKIDDPSAPHCLPSFSVSKAHSFFQTHGLAAKAIGIEVRDTTAAYQAAVSRGAIPVLGPTRVETCEGQKKLGVTIGGCQLAEVQLYGDVVLRFVSFDKDYGLDSKEASSRVHFPFLPHLAPVTGKISKRETFGIHRIDHAVGNVANLLAELTYVSTFSGFHEFAEFSADDVGTVESGLNSVVLASDSEDILLPLNEPTVGRRKSQIQTFLEQNEGAGLQHLALKTRDIFGTIRQMTQAGDGFGAFELMNRPSDQYYRELPSRLGNKLSVSYPSCLILKPRPNSQLWTTTILLYRVNNTLLWRSLEFLQMPIMKEFYFRYLLNPSETDLLSSLKSYNELDVDTHQKKLQKRWNVQVAGGLVVVISVSSSNPSKSMRKLLRFKVIFHKASCYRLICEYMKLETQSRVPNITCCRLRLSLPLLSLAVSVS
jgi:4-hydroxyphenylpyruvate dioxygenase